MKYLITLFCSLLLLQCAFAQIVNHWRGTERDGIYPDTNLLKEWPEDGPEMIWFTEDLGRGFTSPSFLDEKIFITAIDDGIGHLYILSMDGEIINKFAYGDDVSARTGYPGTRSSPLVIDSLVYIPSGFGKLYCYNYESGELVWEIDLFNDFDGENIRWSFTENLIIYNDKIFVSPGGEKYNIVALDRFSGELKWYNSGNGDLSTYCSPIIINHNGNKILVQMMAEYTYGINVETGEQLWAFPYKNRLSIHPNSPVYYNGNLFLFSGYGFGGKRVDLNDDGTEVTKIWYNETIDNQMGGAVILDDRIYLSGHNNRSWYCVDWDTGEILFETTEVAKGTIISADGMLYVYSDRGELALLEPMDDKFEIRGLIDIELGSKQHWAHLVIHQGILYVRHGEALMAFDIRKK